MESKIQICDAAKAAAGARVPGIHRPPVTASRPVHEPEKKLTADAMMSPPTSAKGGARAMALTSETICPPWPSELTLHTELVD